MSALAPASAAEVEARAGNHVLSADDRVRRQAFLLTAACVAAALLCLASWSSTNSVAAALAVRRVRATQFAADAEAIATLLALPQQATEAGLPQADLLDQVTQAMQAANFAADRLVSTLPEAPRKLPGSLHAEVGHRLVFENVKLEPLVRFCHTLISRNPSFRITALHLRAGQDPQTWNADVNVAQWVLSPQSPR
jgi:hypothetical protein